MFDTHCHLNFEAFKNKVTETINQAKKVGVSYFVVPGTNCLTSEKAVEISEKYEGVYAAVGIHPYHVYDLKTQISKIKIDLTELEKLIIRRKVVAIGEVGVDRFQYKKTKYKNYEIDESLMNIQKELLKEQIKLAIKHKKSLILHNREAKKDLISVLNHLEDFKSLSGRTVFHCCEPDTYLLEFAKKNNIFIGIDGDVTFRKDKQAFVKKIPLDLLVLETDSPFLLPEPLKTEKRYPNEPKNLIHIAEFISNLLDVESQELDKITQENSKVLFNL